MATGTEGPTDPPIRRRPTAEEIRYLADQYDKGLSIDALIPVCRAMCGMGSYPVVRGWLLEAGVKIRLAGTGGSRPVPRDTGLSLSPKQQRALKARYEAGATLKQLATEYEISIRRMRRTLVTAGATIRYCSTSVVRASEELIQQLTDMYDNGASIRELVPVYEHGTGTPSSYQTVRRLLIMAGVTLRPRLNGRPRQGRRATIRYRSTVVERASEELIQQLTGMYDKGASIRELIPVYERGTGTTGSYQRVRYLLIRAGVTLRPRLERATRARQSKVK